jgi:hypothetical protein
MGLRIVQFMTAYDNMVPDTVSPVLTNIIDRIEPPWVKVPTEEIICVLLFNIGKNVCYISTAFNFYKTFC